MGFGNFKKTNAEVKRELEEDTSGRGKYNEYMPEEGAQIGKFAAEHGPAKAVRHFSKLLSRKVPETTARRLKAEYLLKLKTKPPNYNPPNGIGDRSTKLNSRRIFQPYGIFTYYYSEDC